GRSPRSSPSTTTSSRGSGCRSACRRTTPSSPGVDAGAARWRAGRGGRGAVVRGVRRRHRWAGAAGAARRRARAVCWDGTPGSGSVAPASAPWGTPAVPRRGCASSPPGSGPSPASQPTPYARYRMRSNDMNSMNDSGVVAALPWRKPSHPHRLGGLAGTGLVAALAAMVATTVAAALAQAVGVDFEVPDGGETIPLAGFAVVSGVLSVVGIVIAVALVR